MAAADRRLSLCARPTAGIGARDFATQPSKWAWSGRGARGGAANTNFWIDPKEDLIGIVMLQFMPPDTYPVVVDFRNLAYQALVD